MSEKRNAIGKGDMLFDVKGRPAGVVSDIDQNRIVLRRRGVMTVSVDLADQPVQASREGGTGVVVRKHLLDPDVVLIEL